MENAEKSPRKRSDIELKDILYVVRLHLGVVITITLLAVLGTLLGHFLYLPVFDAYSRVEVKTEKKASLADMMNIASPLGISGAGKESASKYLHYLQSSAFQVAVAQRLKYRKLKHHLVLKNPKATSMFRKEYWAQILKALDEKSFGSKKKTVVDNLLISVEELAEFIGATTTFHINGQTIKIRARTLDAYTSMEIANTAATVFAESTNQHDVNGLLNVEKLIRERLEKTRDRLQKVELELIEFKKKNRVAAVDQRGRVFSARLNRIEEQMESIKLKLDSNNHLISFYENQKANILEKTFSGGDDSTVAVKFKTLTANLEDLKKQKSMMQSSDVPRTNWRFAKVEQEILAARSELKKLAKEGGAKFGEQEHLSVEEVDQKILALKQENEKNRNRMPALKKSASVLKSQLMDVPEAEQRQLMLRRKVDLEYATFSTLQKRLNEIEIQRISLDKKVLIEELSNMPTPIRRLGLGVKLVFSFLVGLFFSMLIAFLLETTDSSVRSKSDLEEFGINFLGEIPCIYGPKKKSEPKGPQQLVCLNNPSSLNSILFDFVRSRLESARSRSGKDHVTMTVTSSQANEGKSFIASNLAVSLSRLGRKTVIVDCDLRCPSLHAYFDVPNDLGLSDLFETEIDFHEVLQRKEAPLPDIITTGWAGGDPTVIFSSENFRVFMKHLRNNYDYVILDCPPVCVVPDAAILANLSDSALLVARYRSTTRRNLEEAQQKIHQISSKQVHGVINFKLETEKIISYYPYVMVGNSFDDPLLQMKNHNTEDFKKKFEVPEDQRPKKKAV